MKRLAFIVLAILATLLGYYSIQKIKIPLTSATYQSIKGIDDSTMFKLNLLRSTPEKVLLKESKQLGLTKEDIKLLKEGGGAVTSLNNKTLKKLLKTIASISEFRIKSMFINNDLPLRKAFVKKLRKDFMQNYKTGINFNILDSNISVKWNDIKSYFDTSEISNSIDTGIGIFYSINFSATDTHFNYLFSQAIWDKTNKQVIPVPKAQGNNYSFITINSPSITMIPFDIYQLNHLSQYKNKIKVLNPYRGGNNGVIKIDTINHPIVCFYSGKRFTQLYRDNKDLCGDTSKLYLTISNGCTNELEFKGQNGKKHILEPQVPILFFQQGLGSDSIFLNNDDNNSKTTGTFTNRALDVGRLCPPQCD